MSYLSNTTISDSTKSYTATVTQDSKLITKDKDALELLQKILEVQEKTLDLLEEMMEKF